MMDKTIKVMHILPNLGLGGAEIMVENLAIASKIDFDVRVISLYDYQSPITERLENHDIPVYYLGKQKGFDLKVFFRLYKLFKQEKPDVIHTHLYIMPYAVIAAIMARVPGRIHTIHSLANREVGKLLRRVYRLFYQYCEVVPISISPFVKKSVINEYRISKDQVPMIFNGIDLNRCIKKNDYVTKKNQITILHIGRFSEEKNHAGLIDSFKIVHDELPYINIRLQLIGSGVTEEMVRTRVKELNLEGCVDFLGLKSNVYPYLNAADIFVLPSIWEGMPITLIEAMGTGLPIVATKVGGIPDMITNNVTGLLVDVESEAIANALIRLIKDEQLRVRIGNAARDYSKNFSVQVMKDQYAGLYMVCGKVRK